MIDEDSRPRVVLDTNVFVSGLISSRGAPARLLDLLEEETYTLVMGLEQQAELRDVLRRSFLTRNYGIPEGRIDELLDLIDQIEPQPGDIPDSVVVRDPDDRSILGSAIAARASYLVTGDDDLLVLADEPAIAPLRIVNSRTFLDLLESTD